MWLNVYVLCPQKGNTYVLLISRLDSAEGLLQIPIVLVFILAQAALRRQHNDSILAIHAGSNFQRDTSIRL